MATPDVNTYKQGGPGVPPYNNTHEFLSDL